MEDGRGQARGATSETYALLGESGWLPSLCTGPTAAPPSPPLPQPSPGPANHHRSDHLGVRKTVLTALTFILLLLLLKTIPQESDRI